MNWDKIKEWVWKIFMFAVIAIVGLLIILVVYTDATAEDKLIGTKEIYSTNLSNQTQGEFHGGFFISSGQIEDKMVYYIYVESENGMKLQSFEYDIVELVETDDCNPKIETFQRINPSDRHFVIYVPIGTIKNHFNVEVK